MPEVDPANIPLPEPVIRHGFPPHVFDRVFAYLPKPALLSMRTTSRAIRARCDEAMYHHIELRLGFTPTEPTVEFFLPGSNVRVPRMSWDEAGREASVDILRNLVSVVDIDCDVDNQFGWRGALREFPELKDALATVKVIRRLDGPVVVSSRGAGNSNPVRGRERMLPRKRVPTEVCFLDLRGVPSPGCVGVTLFRIGTDTSVLVVRYGANQNHLTLLKHVSYDTRDLVVIFDPQEENTPASAALDILTYLRQQSIVGPLDSPLDGIIAQLPNPASTTFTAPPAGFGLPPVKFRVGPLECFSDQGSNPQLSVDERKEDIIERTTGPPHPLNYPSGKTLGLLTRRELKDMVGKDAWDSVWVPRGPGASASIGDE
ncbi:hypothetical protein Q8F55_009218 [Vanrija albida]|uniref:F-box domain-containing protein n=1 Tax=Vanrija albida TaxID=181172 RepID=A0ABR3PT22_9TREE